METEKRVKEIKESFDGLLSKFETDLNKTLIPIYGWLCRFSIVDQKRFAHFQKFLEGFSSLL